MKIQLKHVKKRFGTQEVLKDINLNIEEGQITFIIGQSGQGKSVLCKLISGLLPIDSGEIIIEPPYKLALLFQQAALFDSMNVYNNVIFPIRHSKLPDEEKRQKALEKLSAVNMEQYIDSDINELSGGMKKLVGLARALMMEPDIILYDEPTTGLDPLSADNITELIYTLSRQHHITSVVISHDIARTFRIADKIAYLRDGIIQLYGAKEVFYNTNDVELQKFLKGESD